MRKKISVIIITLNEEVYLPILLESLKKQTYKKFEVIVSDAHSIDRTREIAKSYGCKIVDGGNYTVGRNNGARASEGDILLFLDADSYLPKDFVEINYEEFIKSKKGAGTVEVRPLSNKFFDLTFFKIYDIWSRMMVNISPHSAGCGIFSTRDNFLDIGGFDEKVCFAENHDFVRRSIKNGYIILPRHMYTSVRRMDKDGRFKFIMKYLYSGLYRLFYKEIDKDLFEYNNERPHLLTKV